MTTREKELGYGLAGAALLIGLALLSVLAGRLLADPSMPARAFGIANGLILAAYGNVVPRKLVRYVPDSDRPARKQAALRFCAWAFTLAGLAHAVIWALVPFDSVALWSMMPIAAAFLLVGARLVTPRRQEG